MKMRVIVLRKQEETPMEELPPEVQQEVEEAMRRRQEIFDEISESIGELNQTIIENFNRIPAETLERVRELLQEAVNTVGGAAGVLRKGEVAIFTDTDLDALEDLVEAVKELTHPEQGAPAFSKKDAKRLLELVKKAEESLRTIKKQLREGIMEVEETLKKQEEEEGLYSPEDIIEREEKERVAPIEGLVDSLRAEVASLKEELEDIEDSIDLLAIPGERDVFIRQGWFKEKVTAIRSHVLQIADWGLELAQKLAELGGVEIKEVWRR
jgi:ribosomal protein L10